MRSFIEFLNEMAQAKVPSQLKIMPSADLEVPDPLMHKQNLGHRPNFFSSNVEKAQYYIQWNRIHGDYAEKYAYADLLRKLKQLADQSYAAVLTRSGTSSAGSQLSAAYPHCEYDKDTNTIYDFTENDIIGGVAPRLHIKDLNDGIEAGIFTKYTGPLGEQYRLHINKLKSEIFKTIKVLEANSQEEALIMQQAQLKDETLARAKNAMQQVFSQMNQPTNNIRDITRAA